MKLLSLFVALLLVPAACALTSKPNFVFILVDDMGWADIGANGSRYYRTPNIDRLASEGVRFANGYAACAVCSPSRAAVLTGQSPARLHITDWISGEGPSQAGRYSLPAWTKELDPKLPNLPTELRKLGYVTASIGKWHLGGMDHLPQDCGFEVNVAGGHIGHPSSYFWPYGAAGSSHRVPGLADAGGQNGEFLSDRLTDEAVKFIGANREKPFFLYLPHYAVHSPIEAKPEDIEAFKSVPPAEGQDFPAYAGLVKSVDDSVGRIMETLRKHQLEENTVVVFTSDNGGAVHFRATKNVPLRAGKCFPYEGGVRVPFIVRAPGLAKSGAVSDARVIGTDFMPTFLAMVGKPPMVSDGVDIAPALRGEKIPERELGWHYPHYWGISAKHAGGSLMTPYSSLISGSYKIVRWYEYDSEEVYDLAKDPSEKHDLAKAQPELLKQMRGKLDAWLKANDAQMPVLKPDAHAVAAPETNPATAAKWY